MKKSQLVGFLLTLFFGPLGLFYSSVPAALGFVLAAIGFGAMTAGAGAVIVWIISIFVGFFTVGRHNRKARLEEKRHQEMVAAMKSQSKP